MTISLLPLSGSVLTAAEMRDAEQLSSVALAVLMTRAGEALAGAVQRFAPQGSVLVLCGPGNNGGDGYITARLLREAGRDVRVAASSPPATDLAKGALARWSGPIETLQDAASAPVLVDSMFGTGLSRPLAPEITAALRRLTSAAHFTVAADLPSGVASDDGADLGCAHADLTVAFAYAKPAHLLQPAAGRSGTVLIADIGIGAVAKGNAVVLERARLTSPGPVDHKFTRGMAAVLAGHMAGAATLAVSATARLAGYTVLCGEGDAPANVIRRDLQQSLDDHRLNAMLIGPGLCDTPGNREILSRALVSSVPLVLDAGALALVTPADLAARRAHTILTPHEGEFARLFGQLPGSKLDRARAAAASSRSTIILKGADTVIASPNGHATLCPAASPWLASAGTGDVLAGIAIGLLAQGIGAHEAACSAVWLHGEAARRAGSALIADDLLTTLPAAIAACLD